jgi:hypothetical protein
MNEQKNSTMSNQQSAPNLMSSSGKTKRDSTRILSNLSGDSRVVPARVKSASSRNKILASLTGLIVLVGAVTWSFWYMQPPATSPSLATTIATTQTDAPTQTVPDPTALALSTLSEPQAALIENVSSTDDASKNGVTPQITPSVLTTPVKPFTALTENTTQPEKTSGANSVEKTDQNPIAKNTAKNSTPAPRSQKADDDADVSLLAALIQSSKPPASAKKSIPKKTPAIAERLKLCQKLGKKEAARCSQKVCEGEAGKKSVCQKIKASKS